MHGVGEGGDEGGPPAHLPQREATEDCLSDGDGWVDVAATEGSGDVGTEADTDGPAYMREVRGRGR